MAHNLIPTASYPSTVTAVDPGDLLLSAATDQPLQALYNAVTVLSKSLTGITGDGIGNQTLDSDLEVQGQLYFDGLGPFTPNATFDGPKANLIVQGGASGSVDVNSSMTVSGSLSFAGPKATLMGTAAAIPLEHRLSRTVYQPLVNPLNSGGSSFVATPSNNGSGLVVSGGGHLYFMPCTALLQGATISSFTAVLLTGGTAPNTGGNISLYAIDNGANPVAPANSGSPLASIDVPNFLGTNTEFAQAASVSSGLDGSVVDVSRYTYLVIVTSPPNTGFTLNSPAITFSVPALQTC